MNHSRYTSSRHTIRPARRPTYQQLSVDFTSASFQRKQAPYCRRNVDLSVAFSAYSPFGTGEHSSPCEDHTSGVCSTFDFNPSGSHARCQLKEATPRCTYAILRRAGIEIAHQSPELTISNHAIPQYKTFEAPKALYHTADIQK